MRPICGILAFLEWYTGSMKRILTWFFVTLGVIFFCLIIAGIVFVLTDQLELKPLFMNSVNSETSTTAATSTDSASATDSTTDKHPLLSPAQETALETVGVDPASIPSSITPEQEACFVENLGAKRVAEIKAGDTPTAAEYFTARGCI